jgi:hypothetical protein
VIKGWRRLKCLSTFGRGNLDSLGNAASGVTLPRWQSLAMLLSSKKQRKTRGKRVTLPRLPTLPTFRAVDFFEQNWASSKRVGGAVRWCLQTRPPAQPNGLPARQCVWPASASQVLRHDLLTTENRQLTTVHCHSARQYVSPASTPKVLLQVLLTTVN